MKLPIHWCVVFETGAGVLVDMLQHVRLAAAPVDTPATRSGAALVSLDTKSLPQRYVSVSMTFIAVCVVGRRIHCNMVLSLLSSGWHHIYKILLSARWRHIRNTMSTHGEP